MQSSLIHVCLKCISNIRLCNDMNHDKKSAKLIEKEIVFFSRKLCKKVYLYFCNWIENTFCSNGDNYVSTSEEDEGIIGHALE